MHVISNKAIREFCEVNPEAEQPLKHWYRIAKKAEWQSFADLRANFPSADLVGKCFVFNIGGNNFRLISKIYFDDQVLLIRGVFTHKDYDKGNWKSDCGK